MVSGPQTLIQTLNAKSLIHACELVTDLTCCFIKYITIDKLMKECSGSTIRYRKPATFPGCWP
jgi:hypothetical protein